MAKSSALVLVLLLTLSCSRASEPPAETGESGPRPSILLVTLDTTRADSIGPGAAVETPAFDSVAKRGLRFTQAYAPAPQTLPSHSSMLTGLYPGGHRVHENARSLAATHPLVSERLREAGYATAAFVSAFPLARRFGLARGFDVYDDELEPGREERPASVTTDRATEWLARQASGRPFFLWVHYFEPHHPYEPPDEFRQRYPDDPYLGEIAAMDAQMGRLLAAFEQHAGRAGAIIIAGDHGEGLGEHGEAQHGNLVYQSVMHVPLVISGPGVAGGASEAPVSIRRIFHTILDWAGLGSELSLRSGGTEVVLGESMIPFLQFGWQPQVMAVEGRTKVIHAGSIEVYDVMADPKETQDLAGRVDLSRSLREAIRDYPIPSPAAPQPPSGSMTDEERRRLASLGYISSDVKPVIRPDAPRPRDMVHLFDDLDAASGLFASGRYREALPVLEKILAADPHNLMTALRIAAAHSALGNEQETLAAFRRAEAIAPDSPDVRTYLALHYASTPQWERAIPMLERIVSETPDRLPPLEALARLRERQGRLDEALAHRQRIETLRIVTAEELIHTGMLAMQLGRTDTAISALERARSIQRSAFANDLELGVLYLAARRLEDARAALDRVPENHPGRAMALFKRAQVSVLLGEADRAARIELARRHADASTRELIENERLFRNP